MGGGGDAVLVVLAFGNDAEPRTSVLVYRHLDFPCQESRASDNTLTF